MTLFSCSLQSGLRLALVAGLGCSIQLQAASLSANGLTVDLGDGVIDNINYDGVNYLEHSSDWGHRSSMRNGTTDAGWYVDDPSFRINDRAAPNARSLNYSLSSSSGTSATFDALYSHDGDTVRIQRTFNLDATNASIEVITNYENLGPNDFILQAAEGFWIAPDVDNTYNWNTWNDAQLLANGHQAAVTRNDSSMGDSGDHAMILGSGAAGTAVHAGTLNDIFEGWHIDGLAGYGIDDDNTNYDIGYDLLAWQSVIGAGDSFELTYRIAVGENVAAAQQAYLASSATPPPAVPEPGTMLLLGLGAGGAWLARRRR